MRISADLSVKLVKFSPCHTYFAISPFVACLEEAKPQMTTLNSNNIVVSS